MELTHDEKKVIKNHYDLYIKERDPSFEHILEMSVDHMILEGVVNLTEDEDGSCEEALITESRIYLESLMFKKV
jgi:hypothetical protein